MSYLDDICRALVNVLESAVFHKDPARLAGYQANIDFWASEIRHCLDCLEGYPARFAKLKRARLDCSRERGVEIDPSLLTSTVTEAELGRLRDRLHAAATRFMRLCTPADRADEFELLLGMRIRDRRPLD